MTPTLAKTLSKKISLPAGSSLPARPGSPVHARPSAQAEPVATALTFRGSGFEALCSLAAITFLSLLRNLVWARSAGRRVSRGQSHLSCAAVVSTAGFHLLQSLSPVSDQNRDTRSSVGAMPARPAGARSSGRARPRPPPAQPGSGGVPPSGLGPQPGSGWRGWPGGWPGDRPGV